MKSWLVKEPAITINFELIFNETWTLQDVIIE